MTARYRRLRSAAAALCFGTAALSAVPAGAGSLLLENVGIGGATFTMNTESFQEKKYKATLAQQYDFSCGSAALATLLTYNYKIPVGEQDVFKDMFDNGDKQVIAASGVSLLDIKNYLARRGLESNGYRAPLKKLAAVRLPAIVLINVGGYSHFVVLDGIRDGYVLLSDPANGMRSEPVGEFENHWTGVFFPDPDECRPGARALQRLHQMGHRAGAALGINWCATRSTSQPWRGLPSSGWAGSEVCSLLRPALLAACAILAAGGLAGCSESRIMTSADGTTAPPKTELRVQYSRRRLRSGSALRAPRWTTASPGGVRGGMSTGSGMMVNFSFQEATYVNHNLTQNIIVPTMTISPGSSSASTAAMTAGGSSVMGVGTTASYGQVSTPSQVVQSVVNNGMTSVVSSLDRGGVTNHIGNTRQQSAGAAGDHREYRDHWVESGDSAKRGLHSDEPSTGRQRAVSLSRLQP
jgi:hypothetical protein